MRITIDTEFDIEEIVYLKTDIDQRPRQIVSFEVFKQGEILYKVIQSNLASYHYEFELSRDKDILFSLTNQ